MKAGDTFTATKRTGAVITSPTVTRTFTVTRVTGAGYIYAVPDGLKSEVRFRPNGIEFLPATQTWIGNPWRMA